MGFMIGLRALRLKTLCHFSAACLGGWASLALAADIALVGLMGNKAMVVIDGGRRQMLAVGATSPEGVKLIAIEPGAAVFETNGQRRRIAIGQSIVSAPASEKPSVTLQADAQGHFMAHGSINGAPMRFIVDTGATFIALGAADARRANIDTSKGTPAMVMTANGPARVWRVKLGNVKLNGISLSDVDATVHEQDMPVVLLGMSFLNRMEIRRDGQTMVLTQRY
ncbi:MAG: TIGR02281 family clan AA aspartic protease [Rhodocyclaceae bacterium]|nr:TIGR02281 family clan AA aspartic protease [Rhodocyclaceae bacterium]